MTKHLMIAGALAVVALPFAIARADGPERPGRRPPKQAFEACANKQVGDACSVTFGDRTITGTCSKGPDGQGALACKPDRAPGPPPEAVEACAKSKQGDACSVSLGDHTISGTCETGPDGQGPLACKPSR
jgi:hypothetical protein